MKAITRAWRQKRQAKIISLIFTYALLILFAMIFAFPLLFMLMSSLKTDAAIFADVRSVRAFLPVGEISLENFRLVFERSPFWLYFRNSLLITGITVIAGLLINSMAAYALSRLRWRGQAVVLAAIIGTLIIPFEAIAIPLLFMTSQLPWLDIGLSGITLERSWLNTMHVQIIPFIASAFSIFLFYQFFLDIPKEIDEAATVDGATPWRIYWSLILPLSRPVFATVAILQFLAMWNAYLWPIIAVYGQNVRPIMPGIQQFFGRTVEWGQIMAYASLITIPILVVFLLFQDWFIRSVASSGAKG
jgi:multiple sugar transport system permease protein